MYVAEFDLFSLLWFLILSIYLWNQDFTYWWLNKIPLYASMTQALTFHLSVDIPTGSIPWQFWIAQVRDSLITCPCLILMEQVMLEEKRCSMKTNGDI